jgi:hypothetical protein
VLVEIVEVVAPVLHAKVDEPVPPEGVAVKVAGSVLAQTSGLLTLTVGFGFTVKVPEPEPVQPFVSVTVTLYVPAVLVEIVEVVAPVLHAKVDEPVPPEGVAVNVAGNVLAHTEGLLTETVGFGLTVSVPVLEPVQPFVSVTVTLYVPPVLVEIDEVAAPVLQWNVTAPVPPEGVAVNVAGNVFAHTEGLLTETVGFGFTLKTTVSRAVPHPWVLTTDKSSTAVPVPVSVIVVVNEVGSAIATRPLSTDHNGVPFCALPASVNVVGSVVWQTD